MKTKTLALCLITLAISGCGLLRKGADCNCAQEYIPGYTPLPATLAVGLSETKTTSAKILAALPNETMQLSIGKVSSDGSISYGSATMGVENETYDITLDYIKFATFPYSAAVGIDEVQADGNQANGQSASSNATRPTVLKKIVNMLRKPGQDLSTIPRAATPSDEKDTITQIPVYVGVGLRLVARFKIRNGQVDLGNIFGLGAAANNNQISGTLSVQTLGISGESISPLIPFPTEINANKIQEALTVFSTIKSKIHDGGDGKVRIIPGVVGFYDNFGGYGNMRKNTSTVINAVVACPSILQVEKASDAEKTDGKTAIVVTQKPVCSDL